MTTYMERFEQEMVELAAGHPDASRSELLRLRDGGAPQSNHDWPPPPVVPPGLPLPPLVVPTFDSPTPGASRGATNKAIWFDEPYLGIAPGLNRPLHLELQAAARIERGPLPDGVAFFEIKTKSADDQLTEMLDRKGTFFEEFVGEVKVGVQKSPAELWEESSDMTFDDSPWAPPVAGDLNRRVRPKYPIMSKAQAAKWEAENNGNA